MQDGDLLPVDVETRRRRWLDAQARYDAAFEQGIPNGDRVQIALEVEQSWSEWRLAHRAVYGRDPDTINPTRQWREA